MHITHVFTWFHMDIYIHTCVDPIYYVLFADSPEPISLAQPYDLYDIVPARRSQVGSGRPSDPEIQESALKTSIQESFYVSLAVSTPGSRSMGSYSANGS